MAAHAYIPFAFQFHYGSIRTNMYICNVNGATLFQFHYGAIRTDGGVASGPTLASFNSIMMQLERRYPEYDFEHFVQFQFHKGAIRTLARRYSFCSYEKSTNFSYVKFSFTYRRVLLSIDSFHQFIWCKYLHL